jgi:TRAP-type C4-dicarboxylate transport system permease small subunit
MRQNRKFLRLVLAAFGLALALPVAMTVTSRIAKASGYIWASGDSNGCDPTPDNPCQ